MINIFKCLTTQKDILDTIFLVFQTTPNNLLVKNLIYYFKDKPSNIKK